MSEQATARYRNDFLKEVEKNVEEGHWVKMCMPVSYTHLTLPTSDLV